MHHHVGIRSVWHSRGATFSHAIDKNSCTVVYLYVCRSTALQHQPFQFKCNFALNPVLTPYICYNSHCTSYLLPLNVPSVYQEVCRACLIGFSEVFDTHARHCNTRKWDTGMMFYRVWFREFSLNIHIMFSVFIRCVGATRTEYLPFSMVLSRQKLRFMA